MSPQQSKGLKTSYNLRSIGAMALIEADEETLGRLRASLILTNKYTEETVCLFREAGKGCLYVPRALVKAQVPRALPSAEITFTGQLRPQQEELAQAYLSHIQQYNGGIIKSTTGSGKTVIGISIMGQLKTPTLIIVPTSHLMEQWRERLKTFSQLKDKDIGIVRGDIFDVHNKKVILGMIHSLCKENRYDRKLYEWPGLVIWDEVHVLGAQTFAQTAGMFLSNYRLGLSATPRRKDNMEKVFLYHIGGICSKPIAHQSKPNIIFIAYQGNEGGDPDNLGRYWTILASSITRNRLIADVIAKTLQKGRNSLLLSERIVQLDMIEDILYNEHGVALDQIGRFTGPKKMGLDRPVILATRGSAGLGADIPRLDTLIIGLPLVDVEQQVGRILRKQHSINPVVIDIIDESSPTMVGWSHARQRYYRTIAGRIDFLKGGNSDKDHRSV